MAGSRSWRCSSVPNVATGWQLRTWTLTPSAIVSQALANSSSTCT